MAEDPRSSSSMFRLAQDLGSIKQGVKQLEEGQREVDRKITGLQRSVAGLVTKQDCREARADLTDRIQAPGRKPRSPTKERPPLLEAVGRKAGAISAILGLLAMAVIGLITISRFVTSLENSLAADRAEQQKQTTRVLDEIRSRPPRPIIIQQNTPPLPDATPRRRRRRKRTAQ